MLSPHDDQRGSAVASSRFSELFAHSTEIYDAIKAVMARASDGGQPIDPTAVVRELVQHYPDISEPPAVLLSEVVRAAADAGVPLQVKMPK